MIWVILAAILGVIVYTVSTVLNHLEEARQINARRANLKAEKAKAMQDIDEFLEAIAQATARGKEIEQEMKTLSAFAKELQEKLDTRIKKEEDRGRYRVDLGPSGDAGKASA